MRLVDKVRASKALRWFVIGLLALVMFSLGVWATAEPEAESAASPTEGGQEEQVWTCSMHPQVRQSEPGQCPICGMDLIPVEGSKDGQSAEHIEISRRAKIKSQIRTASVRRLGDEGAKRRLLGRVTVDESTLRTVTAWIGGRIEKLHVRTTGETVRRGQVIATLYSPEVFSAHQDLIAASRQLSRLGDTASPAALAAAQAAFEASRQRLRLMGVPESEVDTLQKATKPNDRIRIRSPYAGTVIERMATEGSYVSTGAGLYRLANLEELWVELDAYESDLGSLSVGQEVHLQVDGRPDELLEGKIRFIDPVLDARTRTASVRVEVENPEGGLRPGMFVEATVVGSKAGEDAPLVVPSTAPLFTGHRSLVYVEVPGAEQPTYAPREVELGGKLGEYYAVLSGLEAGERVVVHGAFAIDADLQIRGGASMMTRAGDDESKTRVNLSAAVRAGLQSVLDAYLGMQEALASDSLDAAMQAGQALLAAAQQTDAAPSSSAEFDSAWRGLSGHLQSGATEVETAPSLEAARKAFAGLSRDVATILNLFGNPTEQQLSLAHCPMAFEGQGSEWIQRSDKVANPYFGSSMHTCGEVQHALSKGAYLPIKVQSETEESRIRPSQEHVH